MLSLGYAGEPQSPKGELWSSGRLQGGGGVGRASTGGQRGEKGVGSCPVTLLFWTLLFWGWSRGTVVLLCTDTKDQVAKLLALEGSHGHVIVELGQSTLLW